MSFASMVSTGGPWPDGTTIRPEHVLIVNAEDGPGDTIVPRLVAGGANLEMVHIVDGLAAPGDVDDPMPANLSHVAQVRSAIEKLGSVGMIVLDPLMALLPSGTNSYADADVRALLRPWSTLCDEFGACVLLVRHLTKSSQGGPALTRGGGSIGIIGAALSGFMLARHPDADEADDDGRRVLASMKNNTARTPASIELRLVSTPNGCARIEWGAEILISAEDLLATKESEDNDAERSEVDRAILSLFESGEEVPGGAALKSLTAAGFSKTTIDRRRRTLGIESRKAGMGTGWLWLPPPEEPTKNPKNPPSKDTGSSGSSVGSSPKGTHPQPDERSPAIQLDAGQELCEDCEKTLLGCPAHVADDMDEL